MIRSIVLLVDGSRFAESAIPIARHLARSARADLHLVLLRQPAEPAEGPADVDRSRARGDRYLVELVSQIGSGAGPLCDYAALDGEPVDRIVAHLRELAADLVVVAADGPGLPAPPGLQSVAIDLIGRSPVPLLMVRPGTLRTGNVPVGFRSLLVPVDLGRNPDVMAAAVIDFARLTQTHVTLFSVVPPAAGDDPRSQAQRRLDQVADELRARGLSVAARVAAAGGVAGAILAARAASAGDLVALMPRRAEGGGWPPEDSITEQVLRGESKPVLILPSAPVPAHA